MLLQFWAIASIAGHESARLPFGIIKCWNTPGSFNKGEEIIKSVFSPPVRLTEVGIDATEGGLRTEKSSQMLEEKTFWTSSQPFCSAKACSHIVSRPSHVIIITVRCSWGDGTDYARIAASSQTQHPPVKALRELSNSKEMRPDFSFLSRAARFITTHHCFPVIHYALLVCSALLFPPILLKNVHRA